MKRNIVILLIIISFGACHKDEIDNIQKDDDGIFVSLSYHWKKSLHENNVFHSNSYFKTPIQYENNIAIPTTDANGKRYFTMINLDNGETVWQWNDIEDLSTDYIDISYAYIYNNLLTFQKGGWSLCINLKTGTTYWKLLRDNSFHAKISGLNNTYYSFGNTNQYSDYNIKVGHKGDIQTGEIEEFLEPKFSFEYSIGNRMCDVTEIVPYEIDGINHLVVVYQELASSSIWNFQSFLGLYNEETNEWVYERKIMNEPNLNGVSLAPPVIYNNMFYANIGHELICHNISTGEQVWKRQFTQDFMFSGFIIEDDKIIANNEDLTLYCLDPETGGTIWTGEGAGTCSRMSYLNGIVYFVGGGDSRFHAVDIETGETVWRLDAKKLEDSEGRFKTNAVYVIPSESGDKGKVIALTHMYDYCFEAYQ
ncbi:MAG: PQQ-binding-like beta-propeller repeat protein [Bacteroidales bacterium]|nr:PQQ-binding-like beta-propeller repeat protein [Bacteroidales bacterium]